MLQFFLENIAEPVVLVDPLERIRYVNGKAARLFDVNDGWWEPVTGGLPEDILEPALLNALSNVIQTGHRHVEYTETIGSQYGGENFMSEVVTECIQDRGGRKLAAMLRINDLGYLFNVFEALEMMVPCSRFLPYIHQQGYGMCQYGLL